MVKKVVSFTVSEEVLKKWKDHARRESINSSKLVEQLMIKYLKGVKK